MDFITGNIFVDDGVSGNTANFTNFYGNGRGLSNVGVTATTFNEVSGLLTMVNNDGSIVNTSLSGLTSGIAELINDTKVDLQNIGLTNTVTFSTTPITILSGKTSPLLSGGVYTVTFSGEFRGNGGNRTLNVRLQSDGIFTGDTMRSYVGNNQYTIITSTTVRDFTPNTNIRVLAFTSAGNGDVIARNLTLYGVNNVVILSGGT